jgi:DNA adenine methylase
MSRVPALSPTRPQPQPAATARKLALVGAGRSRARARALAASSESAPPVAADSATGAVAGEAGPFVKWVGGKTRLLSQLDALRPTETHRFAEPFVGGGAVFFHLRNLGQAQHALLSDANPDVATVYRVVRDDVEVLIAALSLHERRYHRGDDAQRAAYFYALRERHPVDLEAAGRPMDDVERAARMLFLNRTCFNGLWRENKAGRFNTPHGRYAKPNIVQADKLRAAHHALRGVTLHEADFRALPALVREADIDFVYLDPPYHPISATSAFNAYAQGGFSARDQRELGEVCRELDRMGVRFMLSNSDCELIRSIYKGFDVQVVRAPRAVNCRADRRGDVDEVVVRNVARYR